MLAASGRSRAPLFSALGDRTRLQLVERLSMGAPLSISELTTESRLTRQAITKHLRILETAGLVSGERRGREIQFTFTQAPIDEARKYLDMVSEQWDQALERLKVFVEGSP